MSNHKHGRIVSRFEPLALRPRLHRRRIFTKIDPTRSLSTATLTTSSLKNSWTRKSLICSRKNNTREPASSPRPQPLQLLLNTKMKTLWSLLDHKQTLSHTSILEAGYSNGWLKLVWENKIDANVKNSRNSFEKDQENNLAPFDMEVKL